MSSGATAGIVIGALAGMGIIIGVYNYYKFKKTDSKLLSSTDERSDEL